LATPASFFFVVALPQLPALKGCPVAQFVKNKGEVM
jgi:hypothetical protein